MISHLSIENFALIDKLSIDFYSGFSIITGETGAGKSILLGALGLVLGKRADLSSLKNAAHKCVIEANFKISQYNLQSFFEENDLEYDDETILRREILPSGKSRAFINDSPVNLQELQGLGEFLIDIHSQHQTLSLSEENFQFRIIDSVADNSDKLSVYTQKLRQYKKDKGELTDLKEKLSLSLKEHDYNTFLLDELVNASLKEGEQEELESEFEQLNNAGLILENLDKSISILNDDQLGILSSFSETRSALQRISEFSPSYAELSARINSTVIELQDIVSELEKLASNVSQDPRRLDDVDQKLQTIYNLQKKHQANSVTALLEIQSDLEQKTLSAENLESEIDKLDNKISATESELKSIASDIHESRAAAIPLLTEKLIVILRQLGMPDARFQIVVSDSGVFQQNGTDDLQFLFSANKGSGFGSLKKVASGGELSRIMLAVKSVLAEYSKLPTIIFDEIDTGVSGEIANKMGDIMKDMSLNMQLFAITHLPQIAAKGNAHFKVYKNASGEQTTSELKLLDSQERIIEIAQMLSGSVVSDSAINHAKALLN